MTDTTTDVPPARSSSARCPTSRCRCAERIIELVAMPYDDDAAVMRPRPAVHRVVRRRLRSTVSSGERTGSRSTGTTTSSAPSAGPSRCTRRAPRACVAELRIARTPLGDETLALADDRSLEASVGFAVMPGGERVAGRPDAGAGSTKAFLDHIAMVPEGAYEGRVLAVRAADPAAEHRSRVGDPEPRHGARLAAHADHRAGPSTARVRWSPVVATDALPAVEDRRAGRL